ncbi:gamma carbonic anhydrase family protein [Sphingomonas oleivorans]|uniref:Gamma carbonic anhydrase family protein n=1 Tax=Sphingomonas oleivorans TaxID=1735121 RepID=A0A2T5FVL0_9SPHN|nr:gamma carbonic anhydrase family protein [Sphingomonas oleivorans]PTQ09815.1 gamma carbonic anhydrase family protein [Sphingomonas oleivorans]
MREGDILPFRGILPSVPESVFVAPGTRLIGDVTIGEDASIWYNCVLRGDVESIRIGARTNIQDGTVVHVTTARHSTEIGADCLVGHLAMLHGCKLHDRAFVGMGAIVMDASEIEADGMLAAGALLTPGKRIGAGQMWAGRPARYVRDLSPEEIEANRRNVAAYVALAKEHRAALGEG